MCSLLEQVAHPAFAVQTLAGHRHLRAADTFAPAAEPPVVDAAPLFVDKLPPAVEAVPPFVDEVPPVTLPKFMLLIGLNLQTVSNGNEARYGIH